MSHYILISQKPGRNNYSPSYNCGFLTAGSVFFHKSGQIWELEGIPKPIQFFGIRMIDRYKVGNFTKEELNSRNYFELPYLHFGRRGKVWYCSSDGSRRIRLKWRRCSLTEIRLRQILDSENGSP